MENNNYPDQLVRELKQQLAERDKEIEQLKMMLQKIVYHVDPRRNRGEHIYPTRFRDEAIGLLVDLGVDVKSFAECESATAKGGVNEGL